MRVVLQNGKEAELVISKEKANAVVIVDGRQHVVAFVRDAKKIVIKNDLLLLPVDLNKVKTELNKFIRKVEDTKKSKRK